MTLLTVLPRLRTNNLKGLGATLTVYVKFATIQTLPPVGKQKRAKSRIPAQDPATYLLQIAMLGGYLARNHDPPLGNMVVRRGLTRLNDIAFGISIGTRRRYGC